MIQVLTILQFSLLLLFGIALSMSFADIEFNKKNIILLFLFFMILGSLQLLLYTFFDELTVRKLYPIITHFPLIVILILYYKKRISTAIAATTSAYICCQPARWAGLFIYILTGFEIIQIITTILVYLFFGLFVIFYVSKSIAKIFMKDEKSVYIFGIIPMVYYLFDYTMNIYLIEDAFIASISSEFLPFFLCLVYLLFCTLYYKEHEQKLEMEQKEKLINFNIEQQAKEIEVLKRSEKEMRVIRHDLRLLLNNLSISIQQNDKENAEKMIEGYIRRIDDTIIKRYCENTTINYVLLNFASRCKEEEIEFITDIDINKYLPNETLLSILLSNALDNACNAQSEIFDEHRYIKLSLKVSNNKLLIRISNPFKTKPTFVDSIPVSQRAGHGYGVQSILATTKQLQGNCQFLIDNKEFVVRIII